MSPVVPVVVVNTVVVGALLLGGGGLVVAKLRAPITQSPLDIAEANDARRRLSIATPLGRMLRGAFTRVRRRFGTGDLASRPVDCGPGRSAQNAADRRLGRTAIAVLVMAVIEPVAGGAMIGVVYVRSIAARRRNTRRRTQALVDGLAETIDMFAISLTAGCTVGEAVDRVGRWAEGDCATAFADCSRRARLGTSLAETLEDVPDRLGSVVRPLIAALISTERYGTPIGPSLSQLATEARADRRRRAEHATRRLPVALLFPLVTCVLPAFLLLTVVPVVARSVSLLDFSGAP